MFTYSTQVCSLSDFLKANLNQTKHETNQYHPKDIKSMRNIWATHSALLQANTCTTKLMGWA